MTAPTGDFVDGSNVLVQSDGRILVAGTAFYDGLHRYTIMRYTSEGELDTSFGEQGLVFTGFGGNTNRAHAMALQPDGKILITGAAGFYGTQDICTVRIKSDGTLDPSFGVNGKVRTSVGAGVDGGNAIAVRSDGKVLVAGSTAVGSSGDMVLVRYFSDGSLDSAFGNGGTAIVDIEGGVDVAAAMVQQMDGRILIGGWTSDTAYSHRGAVVRFTEGGLLDSSFSDDGIFTCASGFLKVRGLALAAGEKVLVAGEHHDGSTTAFGLLQLWPSGDLDVTFGNDGIARVVFGPYMDLPTSMACDPNGRILMAGQSSNGVWFSLVMARFDTFGQLDDTFGAYGLTQPEIVTSPNQWSSIALQSNGDILVSSADDLDFLVARFHGTGQLQQNESSALHPVILVAPVPANDKLWLRFRFHSDQLVRVTLTSLAGQVIRQVEPMQVQRSNCGEICIDISELSPGTYVLNAMGAYEAGRVRFMKL